MDTVVYLVGLLTISIFAIITIIRTIFWVVDFVSTGWKSCSKNCEMAKNISDAKAGKRLICVYLPVSDLHVRFACGNKSPGYNHLSSADQEKLLKEAREWLDAWSGVVADFRSTKSLTIPKVDFPTNPNKI